MTVDHVSTASTIRKRADYDIFISYSRRDKDFVRRLWEALEQANQNAWVDWDDIPPTADWREEIYLGIEAADNFVFVISPHSVASVVCAEELAHAIQQGKRLVPIVRQDVDYESVHPELARLNWIFFRELDDFDTGLRTLIQAIATDLKHVRAHTRLLVRAREWESRSQDDSFLLRGNDLEEAEQWLREGASKTPQPIALQRAYISASRQAETTRQETEMRLHRLTPQQYRNRQALLNKVRNFWVKGVLEASLHERVMLELGLEERADAVATPWNVTLTNADQTETVVPSDTPVLSIFDQLGTGRTLLILGEPGSGKTTTLLQLTRDLVTRAEQDLGHPLPVVLNLSSWSGEKPAIADWLRSELSSKYQVPSAVGKDWVSQQQLLLLLDGLDEVRPTDREACVSAINQFHRQYGPEIVVCSRLIDYEALANRLNFQTAIYLRSLTAEQVSHSLANAGPDLAGLQLLLRQDETLRELAKSPLMLNLMTLAYRGVSSQNLPKTEFVEECRQHLFNTYIERMFKRRAGPQLYSQAQVMHWLTWLAQRMAQLSQTVFLIDELQPLWLQKESERRNYQMIFKFMLMGLWGGIHVGLLAGLEADLVNFDWAIGFVGLLYGLLGGAIYGLMGGHLAHLASNADQNKVRNRIIGCSVNGLLLGSIYGPIFGWIYGPIGALAYAAIYSLIGALIYGPTHATKMIEPVDTFRWSWRKARNYFPAGLAIALVLDLGTPTGLAASVIFGCMTILIFSFEKKNEVDRRTTPNHRIRLSARNAGKLFVLTATVTGIALGLVEGPLYGIVNGILFGLGSAILGARGAGITCLKHFALRFVLWRGGCIPWNYARLLNYASDRIFLQKVGGGYVFIHRLLLEHFAQLEPRSPEP